MKTLRQQQLKHLCQRLNYQFKDLDLLDLALSHRSSEGPHNERLEFLGDAVLSCVVAEALYQKFDRAREGQLSRIRSSLVKGETLTTMAKELTLGHYLKLGAGELKSGGHHRSSILEDAFEALIGAMYLDSSFDTCRQVILAWYDARLNSTSLEAGARDSKSRLQEYLQARQHALPEYHLTKTEGAEHCQTFYVDCYVSVLDMRGSGVGANRKQAEQEAASNVLQMLDLK